MCQASQKVVSKINVNSIAGVTVTTFGVDGTLFDKSGKMLYPVISWQCERTNPIMARSESFMSGKEQLDLVITTELDSRPGLYNIGNQWIASGIL